MPLRRKRYKKPPLPASEYFMIVDATTGVDLGAFETATFSEFEAGMWASSSPAGRPFFFRITKIEGDVVYSEDGGGRVFKYRLIPLTGSPPQLRAA